MTDEELAKGWVTNNTGFNPKEQLGKIAVRTFLAGLKAGKDMGEADLATIAYMQGAERYKTKWHDLRKYPDDLPLNTDPVLCLGSTGFIVCKYISGSWVDNQTIKLVPKYIDIYKWCEIEDTEE